MMSALKLSDIARETGGVITGEATVTAVCTDSRKIRRGELFVALVGEHFDGSEFLPQVVAGGAEAAIVGAGREAGIPHISVDDTRHALGCIARMNRRQFSGPVIALTGSAGKTTCKEMIASILGCSGKVLATTGNLNNEIGVPLTLLNIAPEHDYAVVEMGASRANDIRYLTQFAEPTIALVLNAMPAHIEGFGSLDEVARTKGQIVESVSAGGIAIINSDDVYAGQWRRQAGDASVVSFSLENAAADFYARARSVDSSGYSRFVLCSPAGEVEVALPLLGKHNVFNAIAAAATAVSAGASLVDVKRGLERMQAVKGRLQARHFGAQLVIDDTYNANPGAVRAAIDVLSEFTGVRCLVLGNMAELGAGAQREHDAVAQYTQQQQIDRLIMIGPCAREATRSFGEAYDTIGDFIKTLDRGLAADVILVKGSRSSAMENVVEALRTNNKKENR